MRSAGNECALAFQVLKLIGLRAYYIHYNVSKKLYRKTNQYKRSCLILRHISPPNKKLSRLICIFIYVRYIREIKYYLCLIFFLFFFIFFIIFINLVMVLHARANNIENVIIRFDVHTKSSKYSPHMPITVYVRAFEDSGVLIKKWTLIAMREVMLIGIFTSRFFCHITSEIVSTT